jgi:hypothetical protein
MLENQDVQYLNGLTLCTRVLFPVPNFVWPVGTTSGTKGS